MSESTPIEPRDPGAPIARDQIDPDLVKLARPRPKVGIITAAGLVFLCAVFLLRLGPDRRFAGSSTAPAAVTVADVVAGKVETDELIAVAAEPLMSRALRVTKAKGSLGLRLVPVRGTGDRLWIAASGDGWEAPSTAGYAGRLRKLGDLAFADAARGHAAAHPQLVFAAAAAVRAGMSTSTVTTVAGDQVSLADRDAIALDVIAPDASVIVASFHDRLPDTAAWLAALRKAGITPTSSDAPDALGQVRFRVAASASAATRTLETAGLLDARVEPVTRHHETTWGELRISRDAAPGSPQRTSGDAAPSLGLAIGGTTVPDAQIDLVGLYVTRAIPDDAYAVVTGELPDDYWYVMPITVALAVILLVFAWALVRAVRRDLVPARAA